jgi:hypothetical protein
MIEMNLDRLAKRLAEVLDGFVKKFDIQGVVFFTETRLYIRYVVAS